MVWNRIRDALSGPPTLDGPSVLPPYFPVEPQGCEHHAQKLFDCLATKATEKARDMEKAGYGKSYYPDVEAERLKKLQKEAKNDNNNNDTKNQEGGAVSSSVGMMTTTTTKKDDASTPTQLLLPSPNDNPLDECRQFIAYYKRCCDRELKKKKNWILTEPYRVQEEYRYKKWQSLFVSRYGERRETKFRGVEHGTRRDRLTDFVTFLLQSNNQYERDLLKNLM